MLSCGKTTVHTSKDKKGDCVKMYCVYSHTSPSKKVYIGQTSQIENINKRWVNGNGYKRQEHFWNAIQKYGWENFKHKILESNLTKAEADEREKYWIFFYNSNNKKCGYNLTSGGTDGKVLTETAIKNLRQAHINSQGKSVLCLETGVLYASTTMASIALTGGKRTSSIGECCNGKQHTTYGFHWCFSNIELPYETRMKMINDIESKKDKAMIKAAINKKQIQCIETGVIYNSIREAERLTGVNRCCIRGCLSGKQQSAGRHPETKEKLHWIHLA